TATLSGTPDAGTGGTYSFTITAHNGVGTDATQVFTLTVNQAPAITSPALPATMTVGVAVSLQVTATGFPAPTFSVPSGQLPLGLSLNTTTGAITGTPTAAGTFTGTIRASNVAGFADQSFTIEVAAAGARGVDQD